MSNNNFKTQSRHIKKAIDALLDKTTHRRGAGDEQGTDYKIKDPLPEIITGYDPTYILQFGLPPEDDIAQVIRIHEPELSNQLNSVL